MLYKAVGQIDHTIRVIGHADYKDRNENFEKFHLILHFAAQFKAPVLRFATDQTQKS